MLPESASNFFEPKSHTTCRIQLVGPCVTGIHLPQTGRANVSMTASAYRKS